MKKNIIFFVSALESGGLENYLLRFLNEKHKSFHSIYIYCKSGRSGQLENNFTNLENVTIIKDYLPYIGFKKYRDLGELLISKDISVVCDFTGNFSGRVLKIAKKIGVSKRVVFYRNSSHRFKKTFAKLLYNYYVNKLAKVYATDLLSNSIAGFEFFFSSMWEKDPRFKVIYNGLNCSEFLKEKRNLRSEFDIPSDAYIIGHTGRFNEAKNHQMILKVAEFLIKKHKNIYFILCGNEVRKNLNSYLQDKKINNRILAFDNRTDIAAFLNTMDCYFFPSITEGQPNSLIEAMVIGLPFVASDIPSIRETVGDSYTLYSPSDTRSLCRALEKNYLNKTPKDSSLQTDVKNRFDHNLRFREFLDVLMA